jgi:hypothetical protein
LTDTPTIVAITVAISTPITALLTLVLTKGVDAWIKARKQHMEEHSQHAKHAMESRQYDDQQDITAREILTQQLTSDLREVRAELSAVKGDHLECVRKTGILEGKCEALEIVNRANEERLRKMDAEIEKLREWRHDVANKAQVVMNETALAEAMAEEAKEGKT